MNLLQEGERLYPNSCVLWFATLPVSLLLKLPSLLADGTNIWQSLTSCIHLPGDHAEVALLVR